jgi:hypothetical protein
MNRTVGIVLAGFLVPVGAPAVLFFGGGQVAMCLGPIGVTPVQCAKGTGVVPGMGAGLPVLATTISLALLLLVPIPPTRRARTAAGALVGAALGVATYLLFRPRTMEGLDSHGDWISIIRPLDGSALLTAAIIGAMLGFVAGRWSLAGVRLRSGAGTP